jgi:hypothetical protein
MRFARLLRLLRRPVVISVVVPLIIVIIVASQRTASLVCLRRRFGSCAAFARFLRLPIIVGVISIVVATVIVSPVCSLVPTMAGALARLRLCWPRSRVLRRRRRRPIGDWSGCECEYWCCCRLCRRLVSVSVIVTTVVVATIVTTVVVDIVIIALGARNDALDEYTCQEHDREQQPLLAHSPLDYPPPYKGKRCVVLKGNLGYMHWALD